MRLSKSLLPVAAALALASGAAFAQEQPSYPLNGSENAMEMAESELGEGDVIYIYPVEVTEYYILVPSTDTEMPLG